MRMTMTVADFTESNLLLPRLPGTDQASAISVLSHQLQRAGRIEDSLTFFQAVLERDYLASTATENGAAFSHARGRGINRLSFALGLSPAAIRWRDNSPVQAVFLIAVPAADTQLYLALVAGLARLVRTGNLISTLMMCARPEEMLNVLNKEEIHLPATVHQEKP